MKDKTKTQELFFAPNVCRRYPVAISTLNPSDVDPTPKLPFWVVNVRFNPVVVVVTFKQIPVS